MVDIVTIVEIVKCSPTFTITIGVGATSIESPKTKGKHYNYIAFRYISSMCIDCQWEQIMMEGSKAYSDITNDLWSSSKSALNRGYNIYAFG